ncbi:MAG: hypothetical protein WC588_01595 [Candidatus Micrarchaeia archaeon]
MQIKEWLSEKYIYILVLVLLSLLLLVIFIFNTGGMDAESARVYVQTLTTVATLALLYYAYFNATSKKEEDIARLELAVRPILDWEIENRGETVYLVLSAIKHPIYDLHVVLRMAGQAYAIDEKHIDVSGSHPNTSRKADISKFLEDSFGGQKNVLSLHFTCHSEVGGKYEFLFTKETSMKGGDFVFQHRKIIYAKYPWRAEPVRFDS